jgi:hypothetical protein
MRLTDYSNCELEAAIKLKGLNHVRLAEKIGRSTSAVSKVIKGGKNAIESERLNNDILEALKPEIEIIHNAFTEHIKPGDKWEPEGHKLHLAANNG